MLCDITRADCVEEQGLYPVSSNSSRCFRGFDTTYLLAKFQSAYRQFHSTETALLRVCNDILQAIDEGQEVVLVLLRLILRFRYN